MTTTIEATLRLLAWLSPAFPTGGFAWSHGVEFAVETGDVRDGASLLAWVEAVLRHGAGRTDAILLRQAYRSIDVEGIAGVAEVAMACAAARERLAESVGQGNAFLNAARAWNAAFVAALQERLDDVPYAVAVGALAGRHGIPEDLACAGALQAFAANLISVAVRLVPLGQSAGLAALAALEPVISEVAAATRPAALDDIGTCCFRSDLAALRHETQYTRLFRS